LIDKTIKKREENMSTVTKNGTLRYIISSLKIRHFLILPLLLLTTTSAVDKPKDDKFIVVIDAGHGGRDPGALGSKSKEKDIVLAIALKTGNYITQNFKDVEVVYTRNKDVFVDLNVRAEIANKIDADLFISIHANSVPTGTSKTPSGAETFILGIDKGNQNLAVVQMENEVILLEDDFSTKYEGFDPKSSESLIIFTLMQNIYQKQSLEFAGLVQSQFRERLSRVDRGVKQGGLLVLWKTTMPSVLIEVGFISNPAEEKYMNSDQNQDYLASAIFRAFRDYKANIDKKSGFNTVREDSSLKEEKASSPPASEIFFTVQISSTNSKKPLVPSNFKNLNDLNEFASQDRFRYTSGRFKLYQEAVDYRKKIADKFPDAFVIAFKGTNIVPLQQAIESTQKK